MNKERLQELHDFITKDNFRYDDFAKVDGKVIASSDIPAYKNKPVDVGCLAFYTLVKYAETIPYCMRVYDVVDLASNLLGLDYDTGHFLFFAGGHIKYPFNTKFGSDVEEAKAKIKFLLENYG